MNKYLEELFSQIGKRTLITGILNITPDSFYDGGKYDNTQKAVEKALEMAVQGADIIDIGGESTRPGSEPVTIDLELERVIPVITQISLATNIPISIDTYKAKVADEALKNGASIVNDISGARLDINMPEIIAKHNAAAVIMHIKSDPKVMQINPEYKDVIAEISEYLSDSILLLIKSGVKREHIIIDPGFGFGKTIEHNLEILRRLKEFKSLRQPILIGTSRKSTIGKILGDLAVEERLEGTAATVAISISNGADIIRVHDVKEMTRVARMTDAIVRG